MVLKSVRSLWQYAVKPKVWRLGLVILLGCFWMLGWDEGQNTYAQQPNDLKKLFLPVIMRQEIQFQTGPDIYTTSYYMSTIDPQVAYNRGCALGDRDEALPGYQLSLVILDYGKPVQVINGVQQLGTRIFSAVRVPISQIEISARNFAYGYYRCTGDDYDSRLIVGIGTNNYQDDETCSFCAVNYEHGRAWAEMVNRVNDWLAAGGYASQTSAVGANDIELSWNTYERTRDWLDGYESVAKHQMLNYGAVEGCPYFNAPGARCGGGRWSKDQVWYVIWGAKPVWPVPEIYANNGVNAEQWYLMSVYAYDTHGLAIEFRGVMTQYQACLQVPDDPTCAVLDNTPEQGWGQLQNLVNSNLKTIHTIPYVTDIRW
jgi:hypothetical protein